jgi:hypothetical protein
MSWWRKLVSGKKNTSMANVVAQGCVSNKRYHKYSSGTLCNWLTVIKHSWDRDHSGPYFKRIEKKIWIWLFFKFFQIKFLPRHNMTILVNYGHKKIIDAINGRSSATTTKTHFPDSTQSVFDVTTFISLWFDPARAWTLNLVYIDTVHSTQLNYCIAFLDYNVQRYL